MFKKSLLPTLIFLFAIFLAWRIYGARIFPGGPFLWDEAAHALRGLTIAEDLRHGLWLDFLLDTYRQVYWPPIHSWLTGLSFLVAGPTIIAARTSSLIAYLLIVPLLYLAARSMREEGRDIAASFAVILYLTSLSIIDFASQCMLEIPGLFALTLTILIYFKVTRADGSPKRYALLGLGIVFTYFVKSNYGILLFLATAVFLLMEARFRPRSLFNRANFYLVLPMVMIFALWFAYPKKLSTTMDAMVNVPYGPVAPYSIEGFLFYLRAFVHLSSSVWLCAFFVLSLMIAVFSRGNRRVKFLLVLVLLQMLLGELHHDKDERHIFPILPCLFLLAGNAAAAIWDRARESRGKVRPYWICAAGGVLLTHAIGMAISSMRPVATDTQRAADEYIISAVGDAKPALVLGSHGLANFSPPLLDWKLIQEGFMTVRQAGALGHIEDNRKMRSILERSKAPAWLIQTLLPVFTQSDRFGISRTVYLGLPAEASYSKGKEELSRFLEETLKLTPCRRIVFVASISGEKPNSPDEIAPVLEHLGLRAKASRLFPESGIRVAIHETD